MTATAEKIQIRLLRETDSLDNLTAMLHRAYASLAARGMHYVACTQTVDVTRQRVNLGECYVAVDDRNMIVGAVVLVPHTKEDDNLYFGQPHVASFEQFAVEPTLQERGIGSMLIEHIERRALELGAGVLALDTSEHADHLIAYYEHRGYRQVAGTKWSDVNYRSVIMEKALRDHD